MFETELAGFTGREERLARISRFKDTPFMRYRTDDALHYQRVTWILEDILPELLKTFPVLDSERLLALSTVHDDPEIYTGDISSAEKEKMTPEERANYNKKTLEAIERLSIESPYKLNGFVYSNLMLEAHNKQTIEAQLVSFGDKTEGFCESVHEIAAGNTEFLEIVNNYVQRVARLLFEFPILQKLVPGEHPILQPLPEVEYEALLVRGLHTRESVLHPIGIPHYDRWRALTVSHGKLDELAIPKERVPVYR